MEFGQLSSDCDFDLQHLCNVLGVCVKQTTIIIDMEHMFKDLQNFVDDKVESFVSTDQTCRAPPHTGSRNIPCSERR